MPIYDCGDPDCGPCQQQFGPDRKQAIEARRQYGEALQRRTAGPTGGRQAAGGGGVVSEKDHQTSRTAGVSLAPSGAPDEGGGTTICAGSAAPADNL